MNILDNNVIKINNNNNNMIHTYHINKLYFNVFKMIIGKFILNTNDCI